MLEFFSSESKALNLKLNLTTLESPKLKEGTVFPILVHVQRRRKLDWIGKAKATPI